MTDILRALPGFSWRDLTVPVEGIRANFGQALVEHKFVFRDLALVESLGQDNLRWSVDVIFDADLAIADIGDFPTDFENFLNSCRDRSAGTLVDPVLGTFRAKCAGFGYTLDPSGHRSGVRVTADFVEAPLIEDQIQDIAVPSDTLEATIAAARELDVKIGLTDFPDQVPPPEPFVNPLDQISGLSRQVNRNIERIGRTMDDTAFRLDKMNDSLDQLADVKNWSIFRSGQRLRGAARRTNERIGADGRKMKTLVLNSDTTLGALALQLGVTIKQLLALNPRASRDAPRVRRGQAIRYPAPNQT